MFYADYCCGVTRNSGPLDKYTSPELPLIPYPLFPSAPSLPLILSPPSSPSLLFTTYSFPFLPALITARSLGSAIAPPAGAGRARPPNAFWCNSQPKICKSVKVSPTCTRRPYNINSYELWLLVNYSISRCPNFHCNWKIIFLIFMELGGPCTRDSLDFAHPAHPIAIPLSTTVTNRRRTDKYRALQQGHALGK